MHVIVATVASRIASHRGNNAWRRLKSHLLLPGRPASQLANQQMVFLAKLTSIWLLTVVDAVERNIAKHSASLQSCSPSPRGNLEKSNPIQFGLGRPLLAAMGQQQVVPCAAAGRNAKIIPTRRPDDLTLARGGRRRSFSCSSFWFRAVFLADNHRRWLADCSVNISGA